MSDLTRPSAEASRLLAWDAPFLPEPHLVGTAGSVAGSLEPARGVGLAAVKRWPRGQRAAVALQLVAAAHFLFERGWYPARGLLRRVRIRSDGTGAWLRLPALPIWRLDNQVLQRHLRATAEGDTGILARLLTPLVSMLLPECQTRLVRASRTKAAWEAPGAWVAVLVADGRTGAALEHPGGRGRALWSRRFALPGPGVYWVEEAELVEALAARVRLASAPDLEVVAGPLEEADVARLHARAAAADRDCVLLTLLAQPRAAALPLDGGAESVWVLASRPELTAAWIAAAVASGLSRPVLARALLEVGAARGFALEPPAAATAPHREVLASTLARRALAWLASAPIGLGADELETLDPGAADGLLELERLGLAASCAGRWVAGAGRQASDPEKLSAMATHLPRRSPAHQAALVALHDRLAEVAGWCEESLETGEVAAVWAVAAPGATTPLRLAAAEAALAFGRLRDAVARLEAVAEAERDDRWWVLLAEWAEQAGLPARASEAWKRGIGRALPSRLRARWLAVGAARARRGGDRPAAHRALLEAVALGGPTETEMSLELAALDGITALQLLRRNAGKGWSSDLKTRYLHLLGLACTEQDRHMAAATAYRAALRSSDGANLRRLGDIHSDLGSRAIVLQHGVSAERHLQLAERWLDRCGSQRAVTVARSNRAVLASDRLDWRLARELILASRALRGGVEDSAYWLEELELARADLARGQVATVQADVARLSNGIRPWAHHQILSRAMAALRGHLALGKGDLERVAQILPEVDEDEGQLFAALVAADGGADPPPGLPRIWGLSLTAAMLAAWRRGEDGAALALARRAMSQWPREAAVGLARLAVILARNWESLGEAWEEIQRAAEEVLTAADLDGWAESLRPPWGSDPVRTVTALDEILHSGSDALAPARLEALAVTLGLRFLELRRGSAVLGSWGQGEDGAEELGCGPTTVRLAGRRSALAQACSRLLARHLADCVEESTWPQALRSSELVGRSAALDEVRRQIARLGPLPLNVLIQGEPGTGKELVARELHVASGRRGEFVPLNCAGLPAALLEAELFGVVRGAYTGADRDRQGLVEAAEGGTLFLDEVGELPLELQGKLLRLLQEHEVRRVGATRSRVVEVRFLAATNRDLVAAVKAGHFREDLFYRLAVTVITIPPLRERPEDIEELAHRITASRAVRLGRPGARLASAAIDVLRRGRWPGNVRELESMIERALAQARPGEVLGPDRFAAVVPPEEARATPRSSWHLALEDFRKTYFTQLLQECRGNRSAAARRAGMSRQALLYQLRELGLGRRDD